MSNIWQGEKVCLRAVEADDLEGYFCNEEFPVDTEGQRNGDCIIFPTSKELMKERVQSLAKSNPYGEEIFLIIMNEKGEAVGNINTHSCNRRNGTFQYGIGVKKKYRGKGYATDAIKVLLRYYFMELGYHKIETRIYSFNKESLILHKKMGFVEEGILRDNHFTKGHWHDVLCFGMLCDEFEELFPELTI